MRRTMMAGLLMIAVFVLGAYAHEGMTHVMGTISAVDGQNITVKTTDGKSVVVMVAKETKYSRDKGTASAADLKPGARVMFEATEDQKMKKLVAKEAKLGVAEAATEKAAKQPAQKSQSQSH